ncbi:MAG: 1-deoxy-D-xylulose-5-phosphate reductoisomerase [Geobacteraceae bacterium]|nr:1-deoxy-D-xylulose-5-phosphate reductoisomerase [Geobacteraceae bacterium]
MKKLSILGSTGSIGVSTLEVVAAHRDKFEVVALTGGTNLALLSRQIKEFSPRVASVISEESAEILRKMVRGSKTEILHGVPGMIAAASADEATMVVAAIVGAAGLVPTVAAIRAGKDVALANKETLVTAGRLILDLIKKRGVNLYPVDSEHSAVFQSLQGHRNDDVKRIILTASGGPFFQYPLEKLAGVSIDDALNHPNWSMGRKITIDSATMMNKGLEVIEASWLFDIPVDRISVVIHPQSIVHSMVEYVDGCVMAQMGVPDMKAPIAYALTYPERVATGVRGLDLTSIGSLTFFDPDYERFPALKLAYRAVRDGESMPAVMNAANEVAVDAFLSGKVRFMDIASIIEKTMDAHQPHDLAAIEDVLQADRWGRVKARELLGN